MTATSSQLASGLQELVDCRLDTLDRLLMGRVARADRLAIVQDVEAQLHQMLRERAVGEPTRDDVLAVLAQLDPPEAYLPPRDGAGDPWAAHAARVLALQGPPSARPRRGMARLAGILGIVALAVLLMLTPLTYLLATAAEEEMLAVVGWAGELLLTLGTAVPAVVLGILARRGGGWAIAGLVCGIVALVLVLVVAAPLTLLFMV